LETVKIVKFVGIANKEILPFLLASPLFCCSSQFWPDSDEATRDLISSLRVLPRTKLLAHIRQDKLTKT
jgi:hypothetical protein